MTVQLLADSIKQTLSALEAPLGKPALRKVSEACAAMIHAKSVNTSEICVSLPAAPERPEEREQWLSRLLKSEAVDERAVMGPFARRALARASAGGQRPVLCMDQTELGHKHAILMLAVRSGERAAPLCWHVEKGPANVGHKEQIQLLETAKAWLPEGCKPILMADRFYPSRPLLEWLRANGFSWRIRLKGSIKLSTRLQRVDKVADLAAQAGHGDYFDQDALLFEDGVPCPIGWRWDEGHPEGWAIAMDCAPNKASVRDYCDRWGIEAMFSDFKSRGFDLQASQMRYPKKLSKMILLVAVAFNCCLAAGAEAQKKANPAAALAGASAAA